MTPPKIIITYRQILVFGLSTLALVSAYAIFNLTDNFFDRNEAFAASKPPTLFAQELSSQTELNPIPDRFDPPTDTQDITPDAALIRDDYITIRMAIDQRFSRFPEATKFTIARSIIRWSSRHNIDPLLIAAIVDTESNFKPDAVSSMDAQGLMQIRTFVGALLAKSLKIDFQGAATLRDIDTNIRLGVYFFVYLKKTYHSVKLALAAYNIGPGYVDRSQRAGLDPDGKYARKVFNRYLELHQLKINRDPSSDKPYLASLKYGFGSDPIHR